MSINYFPYDRRLTPNVPQELRHDMTPQETKTLVLNFCAATLSNFTNSASLNTYIADFYCARAKLSDRIRWLTALYRAGQML